MDGMGRERDIVAYKKHTEKESQKKEEEEEEEGRNTNFEESSKCEKMKIAIGAGIMATEFCPLNTLLYERERESGTAMI